MSVTHSTGLSRTVNRAVVEATLAISIVAVSILVAVTYLHSLNDVTASCIIYGISLLICSFCSNMYTRRLNADDRRIWRHLDHAAIFILIAGTYTPFVINIDGPLNIGMIWWTWGLAISGVTLRLLIRRGYERLFVFLYVAIGWLFLTALPEILSETNHASLWLLAAGAGSYTIGALLFARDIGRWTDPVWHSFVLGGCSLHFIAVLALLGSHGYLG